MTINGRQKGHAFERLFCKMLRFYGWEAVSSRSENRTLDNLKVDVVDNTRFYFQLKAVERMKESYHDLLSSMPEDKVRVVIHKRNNKGAIAVMRLEDFENLHINKGYSQKEMYP